MKKGKRFFSMLSITLMVSFMLPLSLGSYAMAKEQKPGRFPYGTVLNASDLKNYKISDFVSGDTPTGNLDPMAWRQPRQFSNSNWFASPSLTHYLVQLRKLSYADGITVQFGDDYDDDYDYDDEIDLDDGINPDTGGGDSGEQEDHSNTNVQVEGVDEADIIKTDGKYIYYMGAAGVAIVRAGRTPAQVAKLNPVPDNSNFYYADMYLTGNKIVIIATDYWNECTQFYVYDVARPESPSLVRTVEVMGELDTTRLMNNQVYFVTSYRMYSVKLSASIADVLPNYKDSLLGKETYLVPPTNIHILAQRNQYFYNEYSLVGSFSLTDNTPVACSAYEGRTDAVYMNQNALYLSNIYGYVYPRRSEFIRTDYSLPFRTLGNNSPEDDTYLHRFEITSTGLSYSGMGIVPGQLINQYSMDEYQNSFRVAATKENGNGVYVLNTSDMSTLGSVGGLAPGERIKSVRFAGTTGYVVTFLETDPLFVINLENPTKPVLMGALKIPGFSTYLHPIGNGLVIGVGRAGTDEIAQSQGRKEEWTGTAGMKISMFDVSTPYKPTEVHKLIIGDESTYSEAIYNPKSIMFDAKKNIMTLPVSYTPQNERWYGGMVFQYGEDGFQQKAAFSMGGYYGSNSRFAYIGNILYYVSDEGLMSIDYQTYQPIGQIKLEL